MKANKTLILGAALAGLMGTASAAFAQAPTDTAPKGMCAGGNACKGQSACKGGKNNSCKGQNSCKGHGVSETTKADCKGKWAAAK